MYMIRNPWGEVEYSGKWNSTDPNWTDELVSQIPLGIDPSNSYKNGLFFVEESDFYHCFSEYQIAHNREKEGYKNSWYD
jgi:hypothetical protein